MTHWEAYRERRERDYKALKEGRIGYCKDCAWNEDGVCRCPYHEEFCTSVADKHYCGNFKLW